MTETPTVYLVDDDPAVRKSLSLALGLAGYDVRACESAEAFFQVCPRGGQPGCLVLDLRMPGMDGLSLQQAMKQRGCTIPVIFISADGNIPVTVQAVKEGAIDFLEKPFSTEVLIARIEDALEQDRRQREQEVEKLQVRERFGQLTPREREVMQLATNGLSNKEIARQLDISPRTVENHRARVMEKMLADNIAELCHMIALCPELKGPAVAD